MKMPPKKRKHHLANVKKKPKIELNNVDPRTVLFVDFTNLESLINIFKCPGCQQSGCLTIVFTTNELLNFYEEKC